MEDDQLDKQRLLDHTDLEVGCLELLWRVLDAGAACATAPHAVTPGAHGSPGREYSQRLRESAPGLC